MIAEDSAKPIERRGEIAIRSLGCLCWQSPHMADTLLPLLSNPNMARSLRRAAANGLGNCGHGQTSVINALVNALSDTSWPVRRAAVKALGQLNTGQSPILDALVNALSDVWRVKMEVVPILGEVSKGEDFIVDALFSVLAGYHSSLRENALAAIAQICDRHPDTIGMLLIALSNHDLTQQATDKYRKSLFDYSVSKAASLLGSVNNNQLHSVDMLFIALSDANSPFSVGKEAARALAKLGKQQPLVVDKLLTTLSDNDERVQQRAAEAFESFNMFSPSIIDALLSKLPSIAWLARSALMRAFRISKGESQIINALIEALVDTNADVRHWAAYSLRWAAEGDERPEVIKALLQALIDPDSGWVRQNAADTIGNLAERGNFVDEQSSIIEALFLAFFNSSWLGKIGAARAIGRLCKAQPYIIDTLLKKLSNSDMSIRAAALIALQFASADEGTQPHIINALLPLLSDSNWFIRMRTVSVFDETDRRWLSDTVNALLPIFSDSSSRVRYTTAMTFRPFDKDISIDPHVRDVLRQCLADPNWDVRGQAALALSYIGEELDGSLIEQLLRQYEPLIQRELRGNSSFFDALKRIAEKV